MQILSILSGIVFIVGYLPYILAILRGETKPAKATWIIWEVLNVIVFAGMYSKGALNGQIATVTIGTLVIALLSLKYGEPGWTFLDKLCLGVAGLAIVLWQTFESPTIAIVTCLVASLVGSIPTFENAWRRPWTENKLAWTLYWISCVMAVIAAPSWSLIDAAQPLTFFTIETIVMYLIFIKPRFTKKM